VLTGKPARGRGPTRLGEHIRTVLGPAREDLSGGESGRGRHANSIDQPAM
jgi:hypothetical protein